MDCGAATDDGVTYAALILFGMESALKKHLTQAEVIFEYRSSNSSGPAQQREEFTQGFFAFYDRIWELVNLRNDKQHYQQGLFIFDVPTFNERVVREALLNAVSHRNYQMSGSVFVRQYRDRLVIESPGGFPTGITVDNILNRQSPRNRLIASILALCGLRNMKQIHQWASNDKIKKFLSANFGIENLVCYSWYTQVLGLIKPESFNKCFIKWVSENVKDIKGTTISFDGKTVRSTGKMKKYKNPLHIVSAQIAEYGVTFGQKSVDGKSNEIPAVRELIELLDVKGCLIVADALNCQKETAKTIVENGGDYLLSAKENQPTLNREIADYVEDKSLRKTMDKSVKTEKNRGRIEKRTAYTTSDIDWLFGKSDWKNMACIGAINTQFETENGKSNEWHYYISSRSLSAEELLKHARFEWSVESMHWLLDVHFGEDFCRVAEQRTQESLNIIRKIVINALRFYKNSHNSKAAFSHLMLDCMIDPVRILDFWCLIT